MISKVIKKSIRWQPEVKGELLSWEKVHTVCEESRCPNRFECSQENSATFLIGGKRCTRSCRFCHVMHHPSESIDELAEKETEAIIKAVDQLKLEFTVITSVTRDDQPEELAAHFANIAVLLKKKAVNTELLIPDFNGSSTCFDRIADSNPCVIAHNLETVERLSGPVRKNASYKKSLQVLQYYRQKYPKIIVKSGIMTGLGETMSEIQTTLRDLYESGVSIVTVGQYLRPSSGQMEVARMYTENEFLEIEGYARKLGFSGVACGPFVRSSYRAATYWKMVKSKLEK
ncbi:MAG: lipoyl synthase [Leptospirales bacterium]